ncbi:MAG: hypothetical protein ACOX6D_02195 [Thermoguttaceae bacterium]|jgi:ABC-type transport system involved in multi-copper enzyme maturation permease subunit
MFIGPVFTREVTISPRRIRTFVGRTVYGIFLLLLTATAWLVMTGTQLIVDVGDFSRFGSALFRLIAPLQLMMILFFAAVLAAGNTAQEKDRKTLLLLLLTRMTNSELVLGKLLASLLEVFIFTLLSVPLLMLLALFGGISYPQIFRSTLVILFGALVFGSVGSCIALWREKTFQAVSVTVLITVLWLAVWQLAGSGLFGSVSAERLAEWMSPWKAIFSAMGPDTEPVGLLSFGALLRPIAGYLTVSGALIFLINTLAIARVRIWNPSRELRQTLPEDESLRVLPKRPQTRSTDNPYDNLTDNLFALEAQHPDLVMSEPKAASAEAEEKKGKVRIDPALSAAGGKVRPVWNNPILWREIRTSPYGRRNLIIRFVYFLLFLISLGAVHSLFAGGAMPTAMQIAGPLVPLLILSLLLVNAQAVTSLTSERDGGTFVLLLVSDISPKEFVWGKLGGTFYNMREIILLPLLLCGYVWYLGGMSALNAFFLFTGLAVLYFFAAMIGVHVGMQYTNTRSSLATSLGIIFFLFVGIGTCIWMMLAFSGSFESQLQPFLAFMLGGGVGLYLCLGLRNPSNAIALAAFILPPATFYAITCFLLGQFHWVFLSVVGAYLFTVISMLIPAIDEFDTVTGRTTE